MKPNSAASNKVSETQAQYQLDLRVGITIAKPFLKWAGGKGQLIETLASLLPIDLKNGQIKKYVEPFIGGGALFFHIAQNYPSIERFFISDVNQELILAYKTIKKNVEDLVSILVELENNYHQKQSEEQKAFFYEKRADFNQKLASFRFDDFQESWLERTATIIFLNRTCFNGLFRVNSKGEFNVPFGDYKNPKICDAENLRAVSNVLQRTEIVCADFAANYDFVDNETFVYFDPPYRPISKTASFTSYSKFDFDDESQRRLGEYFRLLSSKGAKLMLSNSDPKNENPNDHFFEDIYKDFHIERVNASRMINANSNGRGKIKEIVVMNYEKGAQMKTGGQGGGSTLTGLNFEKKVDFQELLKGIPGYSIRKIPNKAGLGIFFNDVFVARCFRKYDFYGFLEEENIDWQKLISKRLLPDDALLVIVRETLFIIEVKYQQVAGSVDEKLQTCDFKRKQYMKLVSSLGIKVEYVYVLNDWFRKPEYKDVLDYIHSVNCHYKFDELPLAWLGLPHQ